MKRSDWFDKFKETWLDYPSQDNEGFQPDRAGYKCGFHVAWDMVFDRVEKLEAENARLREALEEIIRKEGWHRCADSAAESIARAALEGK